jgi:hypothetical protein
MAAISFLSSHRSTLTFGVGLQEYPIPVRAAWEPSYTGSKRGAGRALIFGRFWPKAAVIPARFARIAVAVQPAPAPTAGAQRRDLHRCAVGPHGTWRPAMPRGTLGGSFVLAGLPSLGDRLTRFPRGISPFPSSNPIDYCHPPQEQGSCSVCIERSELRGAIASEGLKQAILQIDQYGFEFSRAPH